MLIEEISSPDKLKSLKDDQLKKLAEELREIIIQRVSINGGHLASNLGVVELTIALHYVFDSPKDKIIWDVGHQSYPHKLLTGRYKDFQTLRKFGGISGFPRISESPHDTFGTGHSSTSISAAAGIIEARDLKKEKFKVIAVIGDGALTSGLAFEGLNYAGHLKKNLIVILNDNEMSISPNVGALSNYLSRILTGSFFKKFKRDTKAIIEGIPKIGESVAKIAERAEGSIKGFFLPGGLFEDLGFNYAGPIDGHDIPLLIETLKNLKDSYEPTLVHIVTKKGKGYKYSELDPCVYHGTGPFKVETGICGNKQDFSIAAEELKNICLSYSELFGRTLAEFAADDERIVAITAAMKEGTGLAVFAEKFPDRFYDVGIAEPHAVTFAAGLATQGIKPVVAIYSSFLQRAYDQIIHDVCLQNLPVVFAIDRGGIVGEDGATHQGLFDLSFLRNIPNLVIMSPKDGNEMIDMLRFALHHNGPTAMRYPRGNVCWEFDADNKIAIHLGFAEVLTGGEDAAIIALGNTVYPSLNTAERLAQNSIDVTVINARFLKPLDEGLICSLSRRIKRFITVEENVLAGGFGSSVLEALNKAGITDILVKRIGIDDEFIEHGSQRTLRKNYGLDEDGIYNAALEFLKATKRHPDRCLDL
jgi:1-deoxy-D-xylulose-5-phosphate synthase